MYRREITLVDTKDEHQVSEPCYAQRRYHCVTCEEWWRQSPSHLLDHPSTGRRILLVYFSRATKLSAGHHRDGLLCRGTLSVHLSVLGFLPQIRSGDTDFDKNEGQATIITTALATTAVNSSLLALNVTDRSGMQAPQYVTFPTSVSRFLPW